MADKKQTAVEWLISRQKHNQIFDIETIEQAKQMEREQIVESYNQDLYGGLSQSRQFLDGNEYYEEKYGTH